MSNTLFEAFNSKHLNLKNRVVMAPMTRSRAIGNLANDIIAEYYEQRAEAGLIITEGISPSPNGLGYPRIPAVYNQEQSDSWKQVTSKIQAQGSKIFMQIMHTGRISHPGNFPEGAKHLAPSALAPGEPFDKMYVDGEGMLTIPQPEAMTTEQIKEAVAEYAESARLAVAAGFDGVELHGANGYLINQFLNPKTNERTDEYGGSIENRLRFLNEVVTATIAAIGKEKVGLRVSPYGVFNGMGEFEGIDEQYAQLAKDMAEFDIAYIHIADMSAMTQVPVPFEIKASIKEHFGGAIILNGAYSKDRATEEIDANQTDLVAFGVPFIANPDLVTRMQEGIELAQPNFDLFYTPGAEGYSDYPKAK